MRPICAALPLLALALGTAGAAPTVRECIVYRVGLTRPLATAPDFVVRRSAETPSLTGEAPTMANGPATNSETPTTSPSTLGAPTPEQIAPRAPDAQRILVRSVLFLSAETPGPLEVTLRFADGEPWASYPAALLARDESGSSPTFAFQGRLEPLRAHRLPRPTREHWWTLLRKAAPARGVGFRSTMDAGSERFLYVEGVLPFVAAFELRRPEASPEVLEVHATTMGERSLWLSAGGRTHRVTVPASLTSVRATLGSGQDQKAFRRELERALVSRGLTAAEARAVLDMNAAALFEGDEPRAIYLVPRPLADAMLPLTIDPAPAGLSRLGLAIVDL